MNLAEKLVYLRKEKKLSQLQLAEILEVSRQAISKWESGAATPTIENLRRLAALYSVSLEFLLNNDAPKLVSEDYKTVLEPCEHSKKRSYTIFLLATIAISAIILCTILFLNNSNDPNKMNDIQKSEVNTDNTDDFKLEF